MALVRWEPWQNLDREFLALQREMNRLFDQSLGGHLERPTTFAPAAELEDTDTDIILRLEIPGLNPEDLDIQVGIDAVSITGERRSQLETKEKGVARSEFRYGKFQRVISLPAQVKNTEAKADYVNGILHLTLPKVTEERNKVVKLSLGNGNTPALES